jgi:predicted secreted Zn-dependent protease
MNQVKAIGLVLYIAIASSISAQNSTSNQSSAPLGDVAKRVREAKDKAAAKTFNNDSVLPPAPSAGAEPASKPGEAPIYDLKLAPKTWTSCKDAVTEFNGSEAAHTDTHFDSSFTGSTFQSNGGWTFDGITTVKTSLTVTLPDWVNIPPNDTAVRAAWQLAVDGLRKHEEGHVRISMESARQLSGALISGSGPSPVVAQQKAQQQFSQLLQKVRATHEARQDQYDAQTDHGRKQSAAGGTDTRLICP